MEASASTGVPEADDACRVAVVIPTFRRGEILLDSLRMLLKMEDGADEIVVVDQTPQHSAEVETELAQLHAAGCVSWLRLSQPSIPHAMNVGLLASSSEVVIFLDDDIVPGASLVSAHRSAQKEPGLVAGMVLQPGQQPVTLGPREGFRFNSDATARIREFMGGNFSIRRDIALSMGGFDENFVGAAYRFEAEFAHRYTTLHGLIRYEPAAIIYHLAIPVGGTRAFGQHLRTSRPEHSVGAYYHLLATRDTGWLLKMLWRPLRAIRTRHHLRRPWWIPLTLIAEARGLLLAVRLWRRGPQLIGRES